MRGIQRLPGLDHRCGNPLGELVELNQTGAMEDYLCQFHELLACADSMGPDQLISLFTAGLSDPI